MSAHYCPSCGVAYQSHNGLTVVCRELTAAKLEIEDLRRENARLRSDLVGMVETMELATSIIRERQEVTS